MGTLFEKLVASSSFWINDDLLKDFLEQKLQRGVVFEMLEESCRSSMDTRLSRGDVHALYHTLANEGNHPFPYATYLLSEEFFHGPAYLKLLQDKVLPEKKLDNKTLLKVLESVSIIQNCFMMSKEGYDGDTAAPRNAFQKEPFNIIELPWNLVRFHQWLMPALILAFGMEQETLELVMWPMPKKYLTLAKDFVSLAKILKERLFLGLALLGAMVNQFPGVDPEVPSLIMNDVVLPVLPAIEFFAGEGVPLLRSFKKMVWPQEDTNNRLMCPISRADYLQMEPELEKLFEDNIYHFEFWQNFSKKKFLFGNVENYKEVAQRIRGKALITDILESKAYVLEAVHLVQEDPLLFSDICRAVVKKFFLNPGGAMLTGNDALNLLQPAFCSLSIYSGIQDLISNESTRIANLDVYKLRLPEVVSVFSYRLKARVKLLAFVKKLCDSTEGKLRLAAVTPPVPDLSISVIRATLDRYKKKTLSEDRLIAQLLNERPMRTGEMRNKFWEPFNAIETRIHNLLCSIFSESFAWLESKNAAFPEWQFLQHFLPSFIASMVHTIKQGLGGVHLNPMQVVNYLDALVSWCEARFKKYKEAPTPLASVKILPKGGTFFDHLSALIVRNQVLHLELNSVLHWLFLGEGNKNIFLIPELVFIEQFHWIQNREINAFCKQARHTHMNQLQQILQKDGCYDSFLQVNVLSGQECSSRLSNMLEVARKCLQLPEPGAEIADSPYYSGLHQVLSLITEIYVIFQIKKMSVLTSSELTFLQARFLYLWNRKVNNLTGSKSFEVNPRMAEMYKVNRLHSEKRLEQVFEEVTKSLVEARKGCKTFEMPEGYSTPEGASKSVKKALKRFASGDLETFSKIVKRLLSPN